MTVNSPAFEVPILIPAYRPTPPLARLVESLVELGAAAFVAVDDGSGPEFESWFQKLTVFRACNWCGTRSTWIRARR